MILRSRQGRAFVWPRLAGKDPISMEPKGWIGVKGSHHGQLNMGKRWKKCHVLSKMSLLKHVDIVMLVESKGQGLGFQSTSSTGPAPWSRWKRRKRSCYDGWRQLSSRSKVAKTRSRSYEVYRCFPSLGATSRDGLLVCCFFPLLFLEVVHI